MSVRRLLLGDWHPWLRDPIDLLRALLVVGAAAFALAGDSLGVVLLGGAAAIAWAMRPVLLPRVYDLALVLSLNFEAWGQALGLFGAIPWFDNVVHVSLAFFGAPVVYILLARLDVVPDPRGNTDARQHAGIAIVAFALGVAIGGLWEIAEWATDKALGSTLQLDNDDTVSDLIADSFGAFWGAVLLVCWARSGWGTVRRIPGEKRFDATEAAAD
jgi:hypothetical protein